MKRTMFFKCANCDAVVKYDHPVKTLSKTHNNNEIFIEDDKKFMPHNCYLRDDGNVGIAYLMRVSEVE